MNFDGLSLSELHNGLLKKKFTSLDLVTYSLNKIKTGDKKICAFLTVCEKEAVLKAKEIDAKIARGEKVGKLAGITYSAKDVFSTAGIRTTASSKILNNYCPVFDATVIKIMKDQDAILIGKTNNDAFGFGSSTENSDYQVTRNPWNLEKVAGGSSGGSAAAVSYGMGFFSLAEDTGGSVRQPACFCGVSGIKVTYGRVSRYGVLAYGSSLDTIGVIARSVEDLAYVLEIIAGRDENDATTLSESVGSYQEKMLLDLKGLKVGVPKEYFIDGMSQEVEESIRNAVLDLQKLGVEPIDVSLPHTKYAISAYYLFGLSEVSANLSRYDGVRFGYRDTTASSVEEMYEKSREKGFGPEVKRRIMLGCYALSAGYYEAYYKKSQQVRTLLKKDFDEVFKTVDFLLMPVSPFPAFNIGQKVNDPLQMWLADVFTVTINPAGVPSLAVPCGFTKDNLPIGMQIAGPQLSEELLFRVGYQYQKFSKWHLKNPVI